MEIVFNFSSSDANKTACVKNGGVNSLVRITGGDASRVNLNLTFSSSSFDWFGYYYY